MLNVISTSNGFPPINSVFKCFPSKEMTSEEIADNIGLSRVTIRRYMNYLIETGTISERMNYETGGRPCMLYRWNS